MPELSFALWATIIVALCLIPAALYLPKPRGGAVMVAVGGGVALVGIVNELEYQGTMRLLVDEVVYDRLHPLSENGSDDFLPGNITKDTLLHYWNCRTPPFSSLRDPRNQDECRQKALRHGVKQTQKAISGVAAAENETATKEYLRVARDSLLGPIKQYEAAMDNQTGWIKAIQFGGSADNG